MSRRVNNAGAMDRHKPADHKALLNADEPLHIQPSNLSWLMNFKPKYPGNVLLQRLLRLQMRVCHQEQVGECCPKVSPVDVYMTSQGYGRAQWPMFQSMKPLSSEACQQLAKSIIC